MLAGTSPTDILAELVAVRTVNPPGEEAQLAEALGARLANAGFEVSLQEVAAGRCNLVATLRNGEGPSFLLNTHLDTVPAGENWTRDPFRPQIEQGRLYGRGACDAKGSLAAMLAAALSLGQDRSSWSGTLLVVFVVDEEAASLGAKHYARHGPAPDFVVVGEPTGNRVVTAHRGSLRPLVRVEGRAAHSSTPEEGVNAVFAAAGLLDRLAQEGARLSRTRHPLCGSPSLTVTRIAGGRADNVVPDRCEILIDRRLVPGESMAEVARELVVLVADVAAEAGVPMDIGEWRETTGGPTETPADGPLVRAALATLAAHGVSPAGPGGFSGACDLVHFNAMGAQGIVLGPGDLALAHGPDEYVPIAELDAAAAIYADLARRLLVPHAPVRSPSGPDR